MVAMLLLGLLALMPARADAAPAPNSLDLPVAPAGPRQVNMTADSRPGWIPGEALENAIWTTARNYFSAIDAGDWRRAHAMLGKGLAAQLPLEQFVRDRRADHATAGALVSRRAVALTWTADPANAPQPGVYAAIDIASKFENIDRQCGYVVFFQAPGTTDFVLVREEANRISNVAAHEIATKQSPAALEAIWRQLSANCPNQQKA